jgi:hypothetical protein
MEEVITLIHESEAIVVAAAAGVSAATLQAASVSRPPPPAGASESAPLPAPVLPEGCFSLALELSAVATSARSVTSIALATFGMLLKDSSVCNSRSPPCGAPVLTHVFTALAQVRRWWFLNSTPICHIRPSFPPLCVQHINTFELTQAKSFASKATARAALAKFPDDPIAMAKAAAVPPRLDTLIQMIVSQSDPRSCSNSSCTVKSLKTHRSLLKPASVVTIILGWTSR